VSFFEAIHGRDPRRIEIVRRWGLAFLRDSSDCEDFHREYLFQEGERLLMVTGSGHGMRVISARELHPGHGDALRLMVRRLLMKAETSSGRSS